MASALLGMDPAELPVSQLVRLTGLFGISENRARVALSRMVGAGEATTDGSGRYRLAGHLVERQVRQSRSRLGVVDEYDGSWAVVVVTTSGSTADVRGARRRALSYARLGELREGVWMRPSNVEVVVPSVLEADLERMVARPANPCRLVDRLWDVAGWSAGAEALLTALHALVPQGPDALAPGFELSAAVLRHLQADPLLPAELLPEGWPGDRLRATYDEWDVQYRATLSEWSRDP
jgi:phenylacetic acid degradation operon negative regulatory protein